MGAQYIEVEQSERGAVRCNRSSNVIVGWHLRTNAKLVCIIVLHSDMRFDGMFTLPGKDVRSETEDSMANLGLKDTLPHI